MSSAGTPLNPVKTAVQDRVRGFLCDVYQGAARSAVYWRTTVTEQFAPNRDRLPGPQRRPYFTTAFVAGVAARVGVDALIYYYRRYRPTTLPPHVMQMFGYDPTVNHDECPILQTPPIKIIEDYIPTLGLKEGMDFTGIVYLSHLGSSHFYLHVSHTGNIFKIAAQTRKSPEEVAQCLSSLLVMLSIWGGCMMAGGATFSLNKEGEQALRQSLQDDMRLEQNIGHGKLTLGNDVVTLSNLVKTKNTASYLTSFLARTSYCHALSGSVRNNCYISKTGDIYWFWVGAGGKGWMSEYVNNRAAIHLDIGMWPDMAAAIRRVYQDPELMKLLIEAKPEEREQIIRLLVTSNAQNKGLLKNILQILQVTAGYPSRALSVIKNQSIWDVKGK